MLSAYNCPELIKCSAEYLANRQWIESFISINPPLYANDLKSQSLSSWDSDIFISNLS